MANKSNIEWTDATWNPVVGCSIVSPGCTNCYAMRMAARIESTYKAPHAGHYAGTTKKVNGNAVWTGRLALAPDKTVTAPLHRKTPTMYFVNSMGDLFHEDCPDEWIDRVFAVMALCPQHTFQVLTKRAERMRDYFAGDFARQNNAAFRLWSQLGKPEVAVPDWPLPNVWLGVSCERQQEADERIPLLLQTPATIRFISAEPLLGPIDLNYVADDGVTEVHALTGDHIFSDVPQGRNLDWVIVGGESGHKHRPMESAWAASIIDQCKAAGVAVFMKQMAGKAPIPADLIVREFPNR